MATRLFDSAGFVFLNNRHHDPATDRFISVDPSPRRPASPTSPHPPTPITVSGSSSCAGPGEGSSWVRCCASSPARSTCALSDISMTPDRPLSRGRLPV
jgi:hypothetical protein